MPRRKITEEPDALALIQAFEASGLPLPQFAKERGVDGRSLLCWIRNLERRSRRAQDRAPTVRFVELVSTPPTPTPTTYRLHLDEVVLELSDAFDDEMVRRLVRVLRRC